MYNLPWFSYEVDCRWCLALQKELHPGIHYNSLLQTRGQPQISSKYMPIFEFPYLQFCSPGIDPHRDTPVEILHTWLLGNNKYLWHDTNKAWDKKKDKIFAIQLESSLIDGLTIPPPRAYYLVQYKNSLIGKHFCILQQLGVFHVHSLCSDSVFNLWKATGELGALIWYSEIANLEEYLVSNKGLLQWPPPKLTTSYLGRSADFNWQCPQQLGRSGSTAYFG